MYVKAAWKLFKYTPLVSSHGCRCGKSDIVTFASRMERPSQVDIVCDMVK